MCASETKDEDRQDSAPMLPLRVEPPGTALISITGEGYCAPLTIRHESLTDPFTEPEQVNNQGFIILA